MDSDKKLLLADDLEKVFSQYGIRNFVITFQESVGPGLPDMLVVLYPGDLPQPISFVRSMISAFQRSYNDNDIESTKINLIRKG